VGGTGYMLGGGCCFVVVVTSSSPLLWLLVLEEIINKSLQYIACLVVVISGIRNRASGIDGSSPQFRYMVAL